MKIWLISKKTGIICIAFLIALLTLISIGRNSAVTVAKAERDLPIYCVDKGEEKIISISFDAAWGAYRYGRGILKGLQRGLKIIL